MLARHGMRLLTLSFAALSALAVLAAGCKSSSRPKFTPELMPPSAKPLVLGTSTETDVLAKAPGAEVHKDKSLGGDQIVEFNQHKGVYIEGGGLGGSAYLWPGNDGTPRLGMLTVKAPEGCGWIKEHIAKLDGARNCPNNRKTGESGNEMYYCLDAPDGRVVHVECTHDAPIVGGGKADVIELHLGD